MRGMRGRKTLAVVLAVVAVLFPRGWTAAAEAGHPAVTYRLDLTGLKGDVAAVTMELESPSSPLLLRMEEGFGGGLVVDLPSHLRNLRAFSKGGGEIPVSREGDAWSVAGEGPLTIAYEVDLSGYRSGTPYLESLSADPPAWPYFPLLREDLAYIPGYAVFLRPEPLTEGEVSLEVDLPEGWQAVIPGENGGGSLDDLLKNPVLAGRLVVEDRGSFVMAMPESSSPPQGTREEFSSRLHTLLSRAAALSGSGEGAETEKLRVFLLLHGEGDRLEDAFYPLESYKDTVVVSVPEGVNLLSEACLEAVTRGVVALYLSRSLRLDPESRWLLEGAAWYLQDLLPYETGIWGGSLFWDRFSARYDNYRRSRDAVPLSIAEAGESEARSTEAAALLACGGAAACAAVDAELRAGGEFAGDLVAFLRELGNLEGDERPLNNEDLRQLLEMRSGRSWSAFFADHIQGRLEMSPSLFSALKVAPGEPSFLPEEAPSRPASISDWVLLAVAVAVVLLIPFVLEPYTMRPRKPGFLEKKLRDED